MGRKKIYKGTTLSEFRIKGVTYKKDDAYITDIKGRFDYLINLKKIK